MSYYLVSLTGQTLTWEGLASETTTWWEFLAGVDSQPVLRYLSLHFKVGSVQSKATLQTLILTSSHLSQTSGDQTSLMQTGVISLHNLTGTTSENTYAPTLFHSKMDKIADLK